MSIESATGPFRHFLNLLVGNGVPGVKSLCCIDLTHQPFFHPTTPLQRHNGNGTGSQGPRDYATPLTPAAGASNQKNKPAELQVPRPIFTFQASASAPNNQWRIDCFPLAGCMVVCADQSGHAFRFDTYTHLLGIMPNLNMPKSMPISLFVPDPDGDDDWDVYEGSSLFVMERIPRPEVGCNAQHSDQFEMFTYRKPRIDAASKSWHCERLPPPPYIREPKNYLHSHPEFRSYTVVGGGSHICISVEGVGTYCLDTARRAWEQVGQWTLPFYGKVEYVPELNLWFGLSAEGQHLAAADLSDMDSQPQLVGSWKELDLPEEWKECKGSQLVNLGLGRFCIARFFRPYMLNGDWSDELADQNFTVLTGVEVASRICDANSHVNCSNGNANGGGYSGKEIMELQMIPHQSRDHTSNTATIDAVF